MNHPFNLSVEYEPPMGNKIHPIETPELVQHLNLAWSFSRFLSIGIPWNENDPASTKRILFIRKREDLNTWSRS